jgi:hypothetical protein
MREFWHTTGFASADLLIFPRPSVRHPHLPEATTINKSLGHYEALVFLGLLPVRNLMACYKFPRGCYLLYKRREDLRQSGVQARLRYIAALDPDRFGLYQRSTHRYSKPEGT